jgi:peptidoglycan/xylan/chitin deacetylase (PgdA/CDA1 family)
VPRRDVLDIALESRPQGEQATATAAGLRSISIRRRARESMTRAAAFSGVLSCMERRMREGWTILTYHRVLERGANYPFRSLVTPVDAFAEQVRWLAAECRVLPVAEALAVVRSGGLRVGGRPLVSLTFDDGYADGATLAAPVMEARGVRGTFFVTTGPVESRARLWFDRAARRYHAATDADVARALEVASLPALQRTPDLRGWMRLLKSLPPEARARAIDALPRDKHEEPGEADRSLLPLELNDLAARGHEIASHTVTHPLLPQLDEASLEHELRRSREQLGAWVGVPPAGFCYPNGDHDGRIAAAIRDAGYEYACTTRPGRNVGEDPFRLRRIDMSPARVTGRDGRHDALAFRAHVSLLHESWR